MLSTDPSPTNPSPTIKNGHIETATTPTEQEKPIALIIHPTYDHNGTFKASRGLYLMNRADLLDRGYQIIDYTMDDPSNLNTLTTKLPSASIGFLWIRGHGTLESIRFSKKDENLLHAKDISKIFNWLPEKLQKSAFIYLDSCATGSGIFSMDFINNVQFEFAKLTREFPGVIIAAPSENLYFGFFALDKDRRKMIVEMVGSPNKMNVNIAVILGAKTKAIIQEAEKTKKELRSIRGQLYASLEIPRDAPNLKSLTQDEYLVSANYDVASALYSAIEHDANPYMLDAYKDENDFIYFENVKCLIEGFKADVNGPSDPTFFHEVPLFHAIKKKCELLVKLLLEKGANINRTCSGISPLDYAKQQKANGIVALLEHELSKKMNLSNDNKITKETKTISLIKILPAFHLRNLRKAKRKDEFLNSISKRTRSQRPISTRTRSASKRKRAK